ncbi:VOC family protein [Rhizobium sp. 2YAF20]|uniref:VOC family protein n=1 Tax=Rhizobium sp. 2YAF20 TaxID=3233027 RepID=UPI003F9A60C8
MRCAIAATLTHWVCALWTSWKKESQLSGGVRSFKFLTLYAKQLDRTVPVYEALGLKFEKERHGDGPIHFSHTTGDLVIEIYPADERRVAESMMLGFVVKDLAAVKSLLLERAVTILKDIDVVNGATRMIFQDPDGRRLFISSGG